MSQFFYKCDWIVERFSNERWNFIRRVSEESSTSYLLTYQEKVYKDGQFIVPWIVRAASLEDFHNFVAKISYTVKFLHIEEVEEKDYNDITFAIATGAPSRAVALEEMGQYNEAILYGVPMLCLCKWEIKPLSMANFAHVLKKIDSWKCAVYYEEFEPQKLSDQRYLLHVFVRIAPVTKVEEFLLQLSPYIKFEFWNWLYQPHDNLILSTPNLYGFESAIPFNKDNLRYILELSRVYGR